MHALKGKLKAEKYRHKDVTSYNIHKKSNRQLIEK